MALCLGLVLALTGTRLAAQQPPPRAPQPALPGQPGGQPFQPPGAIDYKELIPALIDALKDSDADVRQSAAGALAGMGRQAVTPLLDIVKDQGKDKDLRANAAYVLGLMGGNGREALPTLTKMLKDDDKDMRRRAAFAIQRIIKETPAGAGMPGSPYGGFPPGTLTPPGSLPGVPGDKQLAFPDPGLIAPSGTPASKPPAKPETEKKEEEKKPKDTKKEEDKKP
jgi:HEAT repeat protein